MIAPIIYLELRVDERAVTLVSREDGMMLFACARSLLPRNETQLREVLHAVVEVMLEAARAPAKR